MQIHINIKIQMRVLNSSIYRITVSNAHLVENAHSKLIPSLSNIPKLNLWTNRWLAILAR